MLVGQLVNHSHSHAISDQCEEKEIDGVVIVALVCSPGHIQFDYVMSGSYFRFDFHTLILRYISLFAALSVASSIFHILI